MTDKPNESRSAERMDRLELIGRLNRLIVDSMNHLGFSVGNWALVMSPEDCDLLMDGEPVVIGGPATFFLSKIGKRFRVIRSDHMQPGLVQLVDLDAAWYKEGEHEPWKTLGEYLEVNG